MVALPSPSIITLETLQALGNQRVEVIEGELIDMSPVGFTHAFIAGNAYDLLKPFVQQHGLGYVLMDGLLFLLEGDVTHLRGAQVPDLSFIRHLPENFDLDRPVPGPPDLAVEVVSPHDDAEILLARVHNYLKAGSEEVWVLYPRLKEIHVYRREQMDTVKIYRAGDNLTAETLFPGLTLAVSDFFVLPSA